MLYSLTAVLRLIRLLTKLQGQFSQNPPSLTREGLDARSSVKLVVKHLRHFYLKLTKYIRTNLIPRLCSVNTDLAAREPSLQLMQMGNEQEADLLRGEVI